MFQISSDALCSSCRFLARIAVLSFFAGCTHPQMGPGYTGPGYMAPGYSAPGYAAPGYQQPMYGPPGTITQPGTLVVPPSNAPPYSPPGNTYEKDTFESPGNGNSGTPPFYEDSVPDPKDPPGRKGFDQDLEAPKGGVDYIPQQVGLRPAIA